jgi:hypothetical protein
MSTTTRDTAMTTVNAPMVIRLKRFAPIDGSRPVIRCRALQTRRRFRRVCPDTIFGNLARQDAGEGFRSQAKRLAPAGYGSHSRRSAGKGGPDRRQRGSACGPVCTR